MSMNAVTGPHKGVAKFLAKIVEEAMTARLNDGRGTEDFEQAAKDIDNLVPGGLPVSVILFEKQWETILNEWLKVLISDHQS